MQVACWEVEAGKILKGCVCNIRVGGGFGQEMEKVQLQCGEWTGGAG